MIFLIGLWFLVVQVAGQVVVADPGPTTLPLTTVYTTVLQNGVLLTVPLIFTQEFRLPYTVAEPPNVGSIGMGTIAGNVGEIRTYETTTINAAEMNANSKLVGLLAGVLMLI